MPLLPLLLLSSLLASSPVALRALSHPKPVTSDFYMDSSPQDEFCGGDSTHPDFAECPSHSCAVDYDCHSYTSFSRCVCDQALCGRVCVEPGKGCRYLADLVNGSKQKRTVSWNENAVGQTVDFSCRAGYRLLGFGTISCQANRRWNATMPTCTRAAPDVCPQPAQMANTVMSPDSRKQSYTAGDQFRYTCAPGYRSTSAGQYVTSLCINGKWDGPTLQCSIVSCGKPRQLRNGKVKLLRQFPGARAKQLSKNYTYGQTVSYICNESYELHCPEPEKRLCQVHKCQADGGWSGTMPVCRKKTCPDLVAPANGRLPVRYAGWNTVGRVVEYSCNTGYRMKGKATRSCRRNGTWDGSEPSCEIRNCGPPPHVPNAYQRPNNVSTTYGSKVTYSCKENTKFEGENRGEIICQKSGQWYPRPPRCRRHCVVPVIHLGVPHIGTADGPVAKGSVHSDTTLWIKCHHNYRLKHVFFPRCDNGTWTKTPECVPKDCEDRPPLINKGIARFYGTQHNSTVQYRCYVGYEITRGASSLVCKFGNWVGTPPKCSRKQCPWIRTAGGIQKWLIGVRGAKNPWTRPETRANHEEIVSFKCKAKGHILKGNTHAICINGRWRPGSSPKCVRQMHKLIPSDWLFYKTG